MRRLIAALILATLALAPVPVAARRALPATDSFDRVASTLGSNWTAAFAAITDWIVCSTGGACTAKPGTYTNASGADVAMAYWNADSFTTAQYSQGAIKKGANGYQGVIINVSGVDATRNGYGALLDGGSGCTIYKWLSGTRTTIGSCTVTWTDLHTLKIANDGAGAITVYDNGVSIGSATDSAVTGGAPGIMGYSNGGDPILRNWQGDNVGGAPASTAIPAFLNNFLRGGGR